MKKHLLRVFCVTVVLMSSSGVLTGCMMCFDCRRELQDMWLIDARMRVGQNMYAPYWQIRNKSYSFFRSKVLFNGNIENEYVEGVGSVRGVNGAPNFHPCHYFYEYEPKSGLIVNFRFEEKEKYDCRATGA